MATKQPLDPSAARPVPSSDMPSTLPFGTKPATDDAKPEYDPSHFGVYEFGPGEREALIKAKKPHIDPRLLQDTVPPNKAVVTKPDEVATTPRGGFAAPKAQDPTARDAETKIAVPRPQASVPPPAPSTALKSAPLAAVPASPGSLPKAKPSSPSSTPPIDTSRTAETVFLPRFRGKRDRTRLVAAVVGGAFILIGVGVARKCMTDATTEATGNGAAQPAAEAHEDVRGAAVTSSVPAPAATSIVAAPEESSAPSDTPPEASAKTAPKPTGPKSRGSTAVSSVVTPALSARTATSSLAAPAERPRKRLFGTEPVRPPTTTP
jgi:hypothetical protein